MKATKVKKLMKLLEKDVNTFSNLDMTNLQDYTNSDIKLETGMVQFIINTIPGDLKICEIDLMQNDRAAFNNSYKKLLTKLKLVSKSNSFIKKYESYLNENSHITLNDFEAIKIETSLVIASLKKL